MPSGSRLWPCPACRASLLKVFALFLRLASRQTTTTKTAREEEEAEEELLVACAHYMLISSLCVRVCVCGMPLRLSLLASLPFCLACLFCVFDFCYFYALKSILKAYAKHVKS